MINKFKKFLTSSETKARKRNMQQVVEASISLPAFQFKIVLKCSKEKKFLERITNGTVPNVKILF